MYVCCNLLLGGSVPIKVMSEVIGRINRYLLVITLLLNLHWFVYYMTVNEPGEGGGEEVSSDDAKTSFHTQSP